PRARRSAGQGDGRDQGRQRGRDPHRRGRGLPVADDLQGHQPERHRDLLRQGRLQADARPSTHRTRPRREGGRGRVHAAEELIAVVLKTLVALCGALSVICGAAQASTLSGRVSSAAEGAMEGVLVSARRDGSPITVTVVSDREGRYRFPDGRLAPGHYTLAIR